MAFCTLSVTKLKNNFLLMHDLCSKNGASLNLVTKFCLSNPEILHIFTEEKNATFATVSDSNMENFLLLPESVCENHALCLIKTRLSDIKRLADIPPYARPSRILVSDEPLLDAVEELPVDIRPSVVLVAETGDLKDGIPVNQILPIVRRHPECPIIGVSVNFSCLSGLLPDKATVELLADVASQIKDLKGLSSPLLSVGGTVIHTLLESGEINGLVQEVRCGEGIFFGYDSSGGVALQGFESGALTLHGEILEVRGKDTSINKELTAGHTATGSLAARLGGFRKRAVLDFGILAARSEDLRALDSALHFAGQTFDFTVVDVTDSSENYQAGGSIPFELNYASASFVMMNRYIPVQITQ